MHRKRTLTGFALAVLLLSLVPSIAAMAQSAAADVDPHVWQAIDLKGKAEVLVILREQADVEGARQLATKEEKGQYVYERLTEVAARTQLPLKTYLDQLGVSYRSYWIQNMLILEADAGLVNALARRPEVGRIEYNHPVYPDPVAGSPGAPRTEAVEWNIQRVNADDVWGLGVTGQGVVVASLDSGVEYTHTALVQQYRGCQDPPACTIFDHNYNWWEGPGGSPAPYDTDTHGTHTTGTAIGSDLPSDPLNAPHGIGMAPGARWIACPGIGSPLVGPFDCFEWFMAPTDLSGQNPRPDLAPHVINNSWTGSTDYHQAIHNLYLAGIFYAKSAGNEGSGCGTVTNPGQWPEVTATAAFAQGDTIATFSSRGPVIIDRETVLKPDIAAPGVAVNSARPGNQYGLGQGTSMACPHTTGAVALLISARPELAGQIDALQWILKSTAEPVIDAQCPPYVDHPNNVWGWGIMDVYDAVLYAQSTGLGSVQGTVTDAGTIAPLEDVLMEITPDGSGWYPTRRHTDASGFYSYTVLPAGTYHMTATLYGYLPGTATVDLQFITQSQNFALAASPLWTVDGTVVEEGTDEPLYATLTFEGTPVTAETDPATGYYSTSIAEGDFWTVVRSPGHAGEVVKLPIHGDVTQNFTLTAIYNYYLREGGTPCGPTFEWIDATGGTPHPIGDDAVAFLSFGGPTFTFYGNAYTYGYIGSNGTFLFGTADTTWPRVIPDPATPNNGIYAFGTDLDPDNGAQGQIYHLWVGDLLVIEWYQVEHYPSGNPETFEIILDFSTGAIWMQYLTVSDPTGVVVGVENAAGTEATAYLGTLQDDLALSYGPAFDTPPWEDGEGTLEGTVVVSGTGDPIAGAAVTAAAVALGEAYSTTTDLSGTYSLAVCADTYAITATAAGYLPDTATGVLVFSGTTTVQDFALEEQPCVPVEGADFAWSPTAPEIHQPIYFSGSVTAGDPPILYDWSFGDVIMQAGQYISHTYTATGTYTVLMTATNCSGTGISIATHTVTVTCEPVQDTDFVWDPITPTIGQVVVFTPTAGGTPPRDYDWDLGDGSTGWGKEVTHTYSAAGTYTVVLTVTNDCGQEVVSHTLTVLGPCEDVAIVVITPTINGCMVDFEALLTGDPPFTYLWDFGDGVTSTAALPSHTYGATGVYTGTLEVWNCTAGYEAMDFTVDVTCLYRIYLPLTFKAFGAP